MREAELVADPTGNPRSQALPSDPGGCKGRDFKPPHTPAEDPGFCTEPLQGFDSSPDQHLLGLLLRHSPFQRGLGRKS